jgi:hypothetical protein
MHPSSPLSGATRVASIPRPGAPVCEKSRKSASGLSRPKAKALRPPRVLIQVYGGTLKPTYSRRNYPLVHLKYRPISLRNGMQRQTRTFSRIWISPAGHADLSFPRVLTMTILGKMASVIYPLLLLLVVSTRHPLLSLTSFPSFSPYLTPLPPFLYRSR